MPTVHTYCTVWCNVPQSLFIILYLKCSCSSEQSYESPMKDPRASCGVYKNRHNQTFTCGDFILCFYGNPDIITAPSCHLFDGDRKAWTQSTTFTTSSIKSSNKITTLLSMFYRQTFPSEAFLLLNFIYKNWGVICQQMVWIALETWEG